MSKEIINVVAIVHGYFPNHNAGAEAMLHQILVDLKNRGHNAVVVVNEPGAEEYEGIKIVKRGSAKEIDAIRESNIIFTHLDLTRYAMQQGKRYKKQVVHLVHNDKQLAYNQVHGAVLAIANSAWIKKTITRAINTVVVYPPTKPERYTVKTTKKNITLINMNEAKGGKMFWQLARILPDYQFLGVKGAYGEQVEYDKELANVKVIDNTHEIQNVYKDAKIVIMPSSYESWGRVAMEAACSGIPVIAAPTPGLKESLDYAGIFAEHDDVAGYVESIRMLEDEKAYEKYSKLLKKRSKEVADMFDSQMDTLEKKLIEIIYSSR